MRKIASITIALLGIMAAASAQTTYYWIGGTGPANYTTLSNWNTSQNGGGSVRASAAANDILIFDGTNVGGATPATGTVTLTTTTQACGQLRFQNGASVVFNRAGTGTGTITINGLTGSDDLVVDGTSTITLGGPSYDFNVAIVLGAGATGSISGTVYISPLSTSVHTRSYITAPAASTLSFETGSACHITDSANFCGFNGAAANAITFKTGASLYYYTGRSPIGNNSTVQFTNFDPGSNFYIRGSNVSYVDGITAYASSSWGAQKTFANVYVQNGATYTCDGAIYKIEHFGVDNGCTYITHSSGHTPVLGNLTVNGTISSPGGSTNVFVMGGNGIQTISGTGSISIPSLTIGNFSETILSKSVAIGTNCTVSGKVNFGTASQFTGTGTFTSRVTSTSPTVTGNTTAGSYLVTNVAGTISGNAGQHVTGTGMDANTTIVGFSTGSFTLSLSKPALATLTGTTLDFNNDTAVLVTANPNGMDTLTGSVVLSGAKAFQSGTNYIINAATLKPFGISSGTPATMTAGSVVLNAAVTTNYNMRVAGTLTLNSGNMTIRPLDTVRIISGNAVAGAPFSSSKYIINSLAGDNAGVLRIDDIGSTMLFPVGSATSYLPVKLTPVSAMDFAVSSFEGVTEEGNPTGTPFTAAKKTSIVDAIWNISRINGTGDCVVETNWPAALEGSAFSAYADAQIGISHYSGGAWGIVTGSGNNAMNTAASTFSSFSPFGVGNIGNILPLELTAITAVHTQAGNLISWTLSGDDNGCRYTIERSATANNFTALANITAKGIRNYTFTDAAANAGTNWYRVKMLAPSGKISYSNMVLVKSQLAPVITLYPNPAQNSLFVNNVPVNAILQIVTADGKIIYTQVAKTVQQQIDITALPAGNYMLNIIAGEAVSTVRFLKQ